MFPNHLSQTHDGHYEFLVMSFGFFDAPLTFQANMNDIFRPYLHKFVLVFFDELLIYSLSWCLHLENNELVLKLLQEHELVDKRNKCHFGHTKVDYFGYVITVAGLSVDPSKIRIIRSGTLRNVLRMFVAFRDLRNIKGVLFSSFVLLPAH